jgi:hypothetical protein
VCIFACLLPSSLFRPLPRALSSLPLHSRFLLLGFRANLYFVFVLYFHSRASRVLPFPYAPVEVVLCSIGFLALQTVLLSRWCGQDCTPIMEAVRSSETSVSVYQTTWWYILEDTSLWRT